MKPAIFTYLKRKKLTDIRMVNRLFVSAFMRHHNQRPYVNRLLLDAYIFPDSEEDVLLCELLSELDESECEYKLEDLTKLFEFVISPKDRKVSGAVYTPDYIRERIVQEVFAEYDSSIAAVHVADIACGCGGFLLTAAEYIHRITRRPYSVIFRHNLYGIDIQDYSIERTKLLLSLLALANGEDCNFEFNLWQGDTLDFDFSRIGPLDIIVGNPPYVCARNLNVEYREKLKKWEVCSSGNMDLYIPFFQVAIENIREQGRVGYITMNSFMTSLNGRALRDYFHRLSYDISIVDFRGAQMFQGKRTYTCLFFLKKVHSDAVKYFVNESINVAPYFEYSIFSYNSLDAINGWKLNDFCRSRLMETVGTPLGKYCKSRHGIATLSNKTYVFRPVEETDETYVIIKEDSKYIIEKNICRRIVNSNKLNSGTRISDIIEYVIFPYSRNERGEIELIPEDVISANYPNAYSYLLSCKEDLLKRDKGKTDHYPAWYAYGRTQSLHLPRYKLFFPKIANRALQCEMVDDEELLLYNGMAFISDDKIIVEILHKILDSDVFWFYVSSNSKPYSFGYYSLNGINIKNFGIPDFSDEECQELISMSDKDQINEWLNRFYDY